MYYVDNMVCEDPRNFNPKINLASYTYTYVRMHIYLTCHATCTYMLSGKHAKNVDYDHKINANLVFWIPGHLVVADVVTHNDLYMYICTCTGSSEERGQGRGWTGL